MTDPTADRLREILTQDAHELDVDAELLALADELDRHARLRHERTELAAPAQALDRIAWELDQSYDLDGDADGPSAEGQELRQIAGHVHDLSMRYRAQAHAAQVEAARHLDELALRALETVLDVEPLGRAAHPLLADGPADGHDEDTNVNARDEIPVDAIRRAVTAVDDLGRWAHMNRKRLALGPLRNDPDARIRSLESVLRRVLVMVDAAHTRVGMVRSSLDGELIDAPLDEISELLWRTINLAAAVAPGPVILHGPSTAHREIPSVVELDEAARQVDRIATLRFDPETYPRDENSDIRTARTAAADAAVALARLGANRPHGIRPGDWPSPWERLDDLAAMLDRAADPDHGIARNDELVASVIERARYLVEQAGGDATRWHRPGTEPDTASSPQE